MKKSDNTKTPSHENELVSIITPTFNAAPYLAETLQTVLDQTHRHWEWIIQDDGSDDLTCRIARDASKKYDAIHFYDSESLTGLAARARNRAMSHAKGVYFAFLDADDLWDPKKLEIQLAWLRDHPEADGVCCWADVFGDEQRVLVEAGMVNYPSTPVCTRSELIFMNPFQTSTLLIRRRCFELIGGMDEDPRLKSGQDFEYFARLIAQCRIHRIPQILMHYRLLPFGNSLYSAHVRSGNAGWNIFEVMLEKGFYTPKEERQKRSHLHYDQAKNNLFYLNTPFRRDLLKSITSGHPPLKALIMFGLSFMGPNLLRKTLTWLLKVKNRF
jgi:glycosyltransferase involved in cell wall biosynthesis